MEPPGGDPLRGYSASADPARRHRGRPAVPLPERGQAFGGRRRRVTRTSTRCSATPTSSSRASGPGTPTSTACAPATRTSWCCRSRRSAPAARCRTVPRPTSSCRRSRARCSSAADVTSTRAGRRPPRRVRGRVYGAPAVVVAAGARAPHGGGRAHRPVDHRGDGDRGLGVRRPRQPLHRPARPRHPGAQRGDAVDRAGERRLRRLQHQHRPPCSRTSSCSSSAPTSLDDPSGSRASPGATCTWTSGRRSSTASCRITPSRRSSRPRPRCGSRCRRCYDGGTILSNEHVVARGVFLDGPDGLPRPRRPYRLDGDPCPHRRPRRGSVSTTATSKAGPRPAPTEPDADPTALPLAGLKVLDVTSWWVGAVGTHFLALDGRGGDPRRVDHASRRHAPHRRGVRRAGLVGVGTHVRGGEHRQARHHARRRNRRGSRPDGAADRVGRRARRELRAARHGELAPRPRRRVLAINPDIVYLRMPGFGLAGPWRDRVAFAQTHGADERAGVDHRLSRRHPAHPRGPADPTAGLHGAFAMLTAITQRDRTGKGVASRRR